MKRSILNFQRGDRKGACWPRYGDRHRMWTTGLSARWAKYRACPSILPHRAVRDYAGTPAAMRPTTYRVCPSICSAGRKHPPTTLNNHRKVQE